MKIAILGATSYIAKDLIFSFSKKSDYELSLFSRKPDAVKNWLIKSGIKKQYKIDGYVAFNIKKEFDVIINFVGVGDPGKAAKMGAKILDVTYQYDEMALNHLIEHPQCKYIFISSGSVYNSNFNNPVDESTESIVPINNLQPNNWYGIAKLYAECRHRSLDHLSIVDLRVFNYFSHTLDIDSRFFIADIVRAIKNGNVLTTTADNIVRDYIGPDDFCALVLLIIKAQEMNIVVDCYTKEPVDKITLLNEMSNMYGLKYEIRETTDSINATGSKTNYYSVSRLARKYGYKPRMKSLDTVTTEAQKLILGIV